MLSEQKKPCPVQTPQGFSLLYNEKYLYSKYNPSKAILQKIAVLNILPGTLFLCCSPALPHGLDELKKKLPENCFLLGCEFDDNLREFERDSLKDCALPVLEADELYRLPLILNEKSCTLRCGIPMPPAGTFRRVIRLDFSAGTLAHERLYAELTDACTASLMTFWTNRITLTQFGRRYSRNLFTNLRFLPQTSRITDFFASVERPILVLGAGKSLEPMIARIAPRRNDFFILCADTALQPLVARSIIPDGVFIEEAQSVIAKAFIGTKKHRIRLFAGLSALPQLRNFAAPEDIFFFTTIFSNGTFLSQLKKQPFLPPENPPFGSVGLTAVHYALRFRRDDDVPVFVCGLDFSYPPETTHARGTAAHVRQLSAHTRIAPPGSYGAAFSDSAQKVQGKDGRTFFTTPVMKNYAVLFNRLFSGTKNLFDAGDCGIPLEIQRKFPDDAVSPCGREQKAAFVPQKYSAAEKDMLAEYLASEKAALLRLKGILTGEITVAPEQRQAQITALAEPREYLYLHFADGQQFSYSQSFLNRIRTEIDAFLKILD